MIRSFRYRLYPTRAQERTLLRWFDATCELYNGALQERREAWSKQHIHISRIDQQQQLPAIRADREDLRAVPILVLRGALHHLDRAFKDFFARCQRGAKPGYPRYRSRDRWRSISIISAKDAVATNIPLICAGGKRVRVPFIGKIKFRQHQPTEGTIKSYHIKQEPDGKWWVIFSCVDVPKSILPKTGKSVGVDLGLTNFAATSDGEFFRNPKPFAKAEKALSRSRRRIRRRKLGSKRRKRARRLLAKHFKRVSNIRKENHISVARTLVAQYETICVEDLDIDCSDRGLARGKFAKSVRDAGWRGFLLWLHFKAESAGREIIKVNPRNTSQACSGCGVEVKKTLDVRVHNCPHCGLVIDRDLNAACNILNAGMALRRDALLVKRRQRPAEVKSLRGGAKQTDIQRDKQG